MPLSQIDYITKIDNSLHVTMKLLGGLYCAIGVAGIIESTDNLKLGLSFVAIGTGLLLIKNRKYSPAKSKIEVEYK